PLRTDVHGIKVNMSAKHLPYAFVLNPMNIFQDESASVLQRVLSTATDFIGIVDWSAFIEDYLLTKYVCTERELAVDAAVVLINHIWWTDLLGFCLFALIVLIQWWKRNRDKGSGISAPGSA